MNITVENLAPCKKLVRVELDAAAVKIAASGSAYYRPGTSFDGVPLSGCAQLAIKFETK